MNKRKKQNLVLAVLNYQKNISSDVKEKFKALDDQWKLPIAATSYWYQNLKVNDLRPPTKKRVMKSILLSFLSDSKCYEESRIIPITRRTKPDHLRSLHAFAQWQCVYIDAMALNRLAQEPFVTTSRCSLFTGKVAMYYASSDHLIEERIKHIDREKQKLFDTFLHLVTMYSVDDMATEPSQFAHPNRFDALVTN